MHWSQSVSTSKFSLGRHRPSVPKKTWAICLGPEFCVPFHLVKNQVEVFRCGAHISLLGIVISGWATTSIFESSWGGASKSCLALRKRRKDCALASIFWLSLCFSLYVFFSTPPPSAPLYLSLSFFFCPVSFLSFYLPFCFLAHSFCLSLSCFPFLFLSISVYPLLSSLLKFLLSVFLSLGKKNRT